MAQGYLLGRPAPAQELERLMDPESETGALGSHAV
jgi:EAL domain-containing protein (putative c-di-GMP-specific phosphodiesterase class I)